MELSRRNLLLAVPVIVVPTIGYAVFPKETMAGQASSFIGTNSGYTLQNFKNFTSWFGYVPNFSGFAFNLTQTGASLNSSIAFICSLGKAMTQMGSKVIWSVPFPGPKQLEAVVVGQYDTLYTSLFKSILAASPANAAPIYVRLPWEFNITGGGWENAALDINDAPSPNLFVSAWRRLANLARIVSTRFQRIWCPGVTTRQVDPLACWPGALYVEIVAQDFYMLSANVPPSALNWYMTEARGLNWGAAFATAQGKPYALTELGFDSGIFAQDLIVVANWLANLGKNLHHVCWWDNTSGANCKLSDGEHPVLGATFRQQFG